MLKSKPLPLVGSVRTKMAIFMAGITYPAILCTWPEGEPGLTIGSARSSTYRMLEFIVVLTYLTYKVVATAKPNKCRSWSSKSSKKQKVYNHGG
jgi:hypothetical protein